MTKPIRQPTGGGSQRQISGYLGAFADLPLGLVLVKDGVGEQLDLSHTHPGPAEAATNHGSLCSFKQVAQQQSQGASRVPPKRPQNKHTQCPASDNIRVRST